MHAKTKGESSWRSAGQMAGGWIISWKDTEKVLSPPAGMTACVGSTEKAALPSKSSYTALTPSLRSVSTPLTLVSASPMADATNPRATEVSTASSPKLVAAAVAVASSAPWLIAKFAASRSVAPCGRTTRQSSVASEGPKFSTLIFLVCAPAPTGTGAQESEGGTVRLERPSVASCSRRGEPKTPARRGSILVGSPPTSACRGE